MYAFLDSSAIMNDNTATVIIRALICEQVYTITAGGLDVGGELVGPQFHQETVIAGQCLPPPTTSSMPIGM